MNVLFLGDIVGKVGREIVGKFLPELKEKYSIDLTIVNGENSAHGRGITKKIYNTYVNWGIDMITMGNHTFSNDTIMSFISEADKLIRPVNRDVDKPGLAARIVNCKNINVGIYNISGAIFMDSVTESPFTALTKLLQENPADIHIVDVHAEATSEKAALLRYFYNKIEMLVGTHTHIQTADECIYHGCAFITDVGMCGSYDSVIGRETQEVLTKMLTTEKTHFTPGSGPGILCGVVVNFDDISKKATKIERIQIRPN